MRRPTIYLAGAIRDGFEEDFTWREEMTDALLDQADILDPMNGKLFDNSTGQWYVSGINEVAHHLVAQDLWCVDRADIIMANLLPMATAYKSIGTMMELGYARAKGALIYAAVPPCIANHPFIKEVVAQSFSTTEHLRLFMIDHLRVLSGVRVPRGGHF